MTNSQRNFVKILYELSNELNFKIKSYSGDWIFQLTINDKLFYVVGYEFPLDISSTKKLLDDKAALSNVLIDQNIACVKHVFFMNPFDSFYVGVKKWKPLLVSTFISFNKNCVVKPNSGTSGDFVYRIKNKFSLLKKAKQIFSMGFDLAICKFENIENEYRVIVLKQKILLIYEKIRQGSWKHNLALGAKINTNINEKIKQKIISISLKASKINNINFCSIDVVLVEGSFKIIEINSGVMLEKFSSFSNKNYEIAKSIYKKAINCLK